MPIAIAVHGGAGPLRPQTEAAARAGCLCAARAGYEVLRTGGSALDAVVAATRALEDDPTFNAGRGSALNADGEVEMDASLMEGATGRSGGVAAVRRYPNPILVARAVMELTPHRLLVADGAERLAQRAGLSPVDPSALVTPSARAQAQQQAPVGGGTVGAVACDERGHLAAATSTGGTAGKLPGRVGDTPLIGCGTWAEDEAGAASATGHGETILRAGLTRFAVGCLSRGLSASDAAAAAIAELSRLGGDGGLILVDAHGRLALAFNTPRMATACVDPERGERTGFLPG